MNTSSVWFILTCYKITFLFFFFFFFSRDPDFEGGPTAGWFWRRSQILQSPAPETIPSCRECSTVDGAGLQHQGRRLHGAGSSAPSSSKGWNQNYCCFQNCQVDKSSVLRTTLRSGVCQSAFKTAWRRLHVRAQYVTIKCWLLWVRSESHRDKREPFLAG